MVAWRIYRYMRPNSRNASVLRAAVFVLSFLAFYQSSIFSISVRLDLRHVL